MLRLQVDTCSMLPSQLKEQVGAYVGDLLKPRFKSNAITKEDYKWIVRKTVEKVQNNYVRFLLLSLAGTGQCCISRLTDSAGQMLPYGGYRQRNTAVQAYQNSMQTSQLLFFPAGCFFFNKRIRIRLSY